MFMGKKLTLAAGAAALLTAATLSPAHAGLLGSTYDASLSQTGSVTILGAPGPGPYTVGTGTPGFCIGPANGCAIHSGLSGQADATDQQVTLSFSGSTDASSGTFTLVLDNFSTPITGLTHVSGSLDVGSLASFSSTSDSMTFVFSDVAAGSFGALGGVDIVFDVTSAPEPASMALLGVGLAGLGMIRRRRAG
jgi:hypothetical protein